LVMPVLDGPERMLHDLFAPPHERRMRLDPLWPPFEEGLVHPAGKAAAPVMPCTAHRAGTGTTSGGRLGANLPPQLDGRNAAGQRLSGGASGTGMLRRRGERLVRIEPSCAMGRRARLGHIGCNARVCTGFDGLTVRVAPLGHHVDRLNRPGLLGL